MKILTRKRIAKVRLTFLMMTVILLMSCEQKSPNTKDVRSLDDLKKAISVIHERREFENKIVSQEEYAISLLTENIEKSNSEGMKDKIREEILVKRAVVAKAKNNIENQDLILEELSGKRDSIEALNALRIE